MTSTRKQGQEGSNLRNLLIALPYIILIVCLVASYLAWNFAEQQLMISEKSKLDAIADRFSDIVSEQMRKYDDLASGAVGLFAASNSVERYEWRNYVQEMKNSDPGILEDLLFVKRVTRDGMQDYISSMRADKSVKGLNLGNFTIFPESNDSEFYVITYVDSDAETYNIGYDLYTDTNFRMPIEKCRDSEKHALTSTFTVNNDGKGEEDFMLLRPIFPPNTNLSNITLDERRHMMIGIIGIQVNLETMLDKSLDNIDYEISQNSLFTGMVIEPTDDYSGGPDNDRNTSLKGIDIEIFQDSIMSNDMMVYDSDRDSRFFNETDKVKYVTLRHIQMADRVWTVYFAATTDFGLSTMSDQIPIIVLIIGVILSLLAFGLFHYMIESNEKSHSIAQKMTEGYNESTAKLIELNQIINKSPAVVYLAKAEKGWPMEYISDNVSQYGYEAKDMMDGKVSIWSDVIHPDDLPVLINILKENSEKSIDEFTTRFRAYTKSRDIIWLENRCKLRKDASGKLTHFEGIIVDITDKKKADDEILKKNVELEKFNKVVIDRELKMVELKKKIEDMKGKSSERQ